MDIFVYYYKKHMAMHVSIAWYPVDACWRAMLTLMRVYFYFLKV